MIVRRHAAAIAAAWLSLHTAACRGGGTAQSSRGATRPAGDANPASMDSVAEATPADSASQQEMAIDVIRRYYAALNAHDFRTAYSLWEGNGTASHKSLEEFAAGFRNTARTSVQIGSPGRIEGAAGSRYLAVPVKVLAETRAGERQQFNGTYTLRRSVVDGATAEQRRWRIYSAALNPEAKRPSA